MSNTVQKPDANPVVSALVTAFVFNLGHWLIIEWVPKEDSQVQKLLASRRDIFSGYHMEGFEAAFNRCFKTVEKIPVYDSLRVLYLMESR